MEDQFLRRLMEGRSILLTNICFENDGEYWNNILISPSLKHIVFWITQKRLTLYLVSKEFDYEHKEAKVIWNENKLDLTSVCFSHDAKELSVLIKSPNPKVIIYNLADEKVTKTCEASLAEIYLLRSVSVRSNEDVCGSSVVSKEVETLIRVWRDNLALFASGTLQGFSIRDGNECVQNYAVNLESGAATYCFNSNFFYYLARSGILYIYQLDDGNLSGVFDVYSVLPKNIEFSQIYINSSGHQLAVLGRSNEIYLLDVSNTKVPPSFPHHPPSAKESSSSVSSFKTTVSKISSRVDSIKKEALTRKISSIANASSATSNWITYLQKLRSSNKHNNVPEVEEESGHFICINDVPINFTIQSINFLQDSLGVWATPPDKMSEGFYRVYDVVSGRLESADILAPNARIVCLNGSGVSVDLLLQGSSLSLPLGVISQDTLIQKMVGGESESLVGGMVGKVVLPLPLLQDGLSNHHLDMVRLAFNLDTQGFKSKLSKKHAVNELLESTKQLFETIESAVGDEQWTQQIFRLSLIHANTLLSLLSSTTSQDQLMIEILKYIAVLRRRLKDVVVSIELPNILHWTPWLSLSDGEVVLEGVNVSLALVHCFLALHRGWTEDEIHGDRFHILVQDVITKLLKEKNLEHARYLLGKVNLNPEEEFLALCLKCEDPVLRDYLVGSLGDCVTPEQSNAWQFILLVESVLVHYSVHNSSAVESPLTLSHVLLLSEKEKAQILADLYFSSGEANLKTHLDKQTCWDYLLEHNYTDGLLVWITQEQLNTGFNWPVELFSLWEIEQSMVDKVLTVDCSELTRHIVLNKLATIGIHPNIDVQSPRDLVLRMSNAQIFPDEEKSLSQSTANLNYHKFCEIMLKHAVRSNLIEVVVKTNLDKVHLDDKIDPDWLRLFKTHKEAGRTLAGDDILQAVEGCAKYIASVESLDQTLYLKQHPLVALVLDNLKSQNVCQLYSHISPLLASALPVDPPAQDIDLYSVLAHTVPFHTDNIFKHQLSRNTPLPSFTDENLNLRYGINFSLDFKEFLKQGRPGSALSFVMRKGKTSVRKKATVRYAHGLALCNADDLVVTSACIAFVELLGKNSTLLRTHVAVARALVGYMEVKTLKEHLYNLVQGKSGAAAALLVELENWLMVKWSSGSGSSVVDCLREFHLAVRFAVCHKLPPPSALLRHSLQTDNWLLFILTVQLFQYPLPEVQEVCSMNGRHVISEHLYHSLHNTARSQSEEKESRSFESETNLFACLAQFGNEVGKLFSLSRELNNPALALLAASLQPHPVEAGLCHWLVASLPWDESQQMPDSLWSADATTQLIEHVVRLGYLHTLAHAFTVFQPANPLCALGNFLVDSVMNHNFKDSILNLKLFMGNFVKLSNEGHQESAFLMRRSWVAMTAYRVVCTALAYCFPSGYLRHCFLKTLCEVQFSETVQADQSLPLYLRLSECLMPSQMQLDWKQLCLDEDLSQLAQMLHSLTEQHMFDMAFKFALIAGLPCDNVLVTQWSVLASTTELKEQDFWKRCEAAFQQANIDPDIAVSFYQCEAATSENLQERYVLLKFALGWMYKTVAEPETITQLQTELYSTCLHDSFKIEVITEGVSPLSLRCLSDDLATSSVTSPPKLTSGQSHRLDTIIHQLLIVGDINTAFILQSIFHHTNQDCELLLSCMKLAEGVKSVPQLPPRIQEYLTDETVRRPKMTMSSPFPKMRSKNNLLQSDHQSVLNALYALQAHQTCATALFSNIINAFKVSLALGCDYKEIILDSEPLNRLQPEHDFDIATGLLNLAGLSRYECTQYVCSQIVTLLSSEPENGKFMLWSCDLDTEFSCILELSGSALLLGNLLLASDPLASYHPSTYRQDVELLVLAHSCFTKVCHMEGISTVLNMSRVLTSRLLNSNQWPLMVRLLTGIGRYTEMSYIFQILKDNDQFEYLLGKGLDKHPSLMAASLEFVRHDKDLFSLVAHHFSMYSELAALYEEEAKTELGHIEISGAGIAVNAQNKALLQTVMSKFSDATEHYMQAKKMKCGVACVQQAELIAVQLSLLSNNSESHVPCLVNLSQDQVVTLVNTVLSYEQAHIVASAYNIAVDWSAALYHNCVLKGDTSYLNTWTRHHELSKTVVQDVVRRFQSERDVSSAMEMNMKWLVSSVNLIDVKYRVASQLGFKDILHHLLTSPDMAYLKDTVWQSGFKNQIL